MISYLYYAKKKQKQKQQQQEYTPLYRSQYYWRASVASETLTGVKMKKSGMFVYLYICMDVRKAFLYFDPRVFVLVRLSTPSQIALNRILWFIDQYPYHPSN